VENIESGQQVRWVYAADGSGVDLSARAVVLHTDGATHARILIEEPTGEVLAAIRYGAGWHGTVADPTCYEAGARITVNVKSLRPAGSRPQVASFGWLD
jgi:hypothetical protein